MIIFHGGELDGLLTVWAEVSDYDVPSAGRTKRARKKQGAPPPHPFAAGLSDMRDALQPLLPGLRLSYLECKAAAWIPSQKDGPIPSSEIIAVTRESVAKTKVAPWTITACRFNGNDAAKLLRIAVGKRTLAPGVVVGNSLSFWADALRLTSSIVARQQFLPGLVEKDKSYHAVWNPVFAGMDAERLGDLAVRMPAVCRAITWPDAKTAPKTPPLDALSPVITGMVDSMARGGIMRGQSRSRSTTGKFESAHDAWLHALSSDDGKMDRDAAELSKFSAHVQEWQRPVAVSSKSPLRLCFRLVEPETKGRGISKAWRMQYLVNPHSDPSLLVPAEKLWKGRGGIPGRNAYGDKEFLLISLGHASELSKSIAAGLKTGGMSGFEMNVSAAYEFLKTEAAALEQAGYGIMLPSWWAGGRTKARIVVRAKAKKPAMSGGTGITVESILSFDWDVALGGQKMTLRELERLAKLKAPLVQVRGQWIDANGAAIQAAIEMLKKAPKRATVREAALLKLKEGAGMPDMPEICITGSTKTVTEIFEGLEEKEKLKELDQPTGFSGTLRPYQMRGYSWLSFLQKWGLGGCLADDMGLGKTVQMLALVQQYVEAGGSGPVLLVCPMSLIENWRMETARFAPDLPVMIHHGTGRKSGAAFKKEAKRHALVISSYGLMHRDMDSIKKVQWGGVVLDEAQNVKNHDTKQARAVRALDTGFRFALTGTPVENNVGDLWSIMDFLNPGFLGTRQEFVRNFFVPIQITRDADAAERLRNATGPFILRRLKTDKSIIADLPEKMEMKVYCPLTKEQASLYALVLKELDGPLESAQGIQRRGIILGMLSKLKQVCNHPAQFLKDDSGIGGRSGKMALLTEMLAEAIDAGDRVLIFSQFAEMGRIIQRHIHETFGLEAPFLHGAVPRARRAQMVERFQDPSGTGPRIFVLSLKAGGTGLNLTAANRVIHFDRWWNPAVEDQATDRAFRIGQTRNVQVHKFVCAGTLEERIDEMIERKKQVSREVVGTGEGWLTELSNDDLRDVLRLGSEAAVI